MYSGNKAPDYNLFPTPHWYDSFYEYFNKDSIKEEYLSLIKDLDDKSVKVVSKILHRIRNFQSNGFDSSHLSAEEAEDKEKVSDFVEQIVALGNNLFAWNKYILPIDYFEYGIFKKKYHIDEFLNVDRNKNILDVGAFIGDSAIVLKDFTIRNVFAFEPCQKNYDLLLQTLELNHADNVVPVNIGLGEENAQVKLYGADIGASVVRERDNEHSSDITIQRLDDWIRDNPMEIGLIKVDIEGAEQMFLRGAYNTIKTQRPNMIISIYHGGHDFFLIKPLIESWNLGYKFKIVKTSPCFLSDETVLLCEAVK